MTLKKIRYFIEAVFVYTAYFLLKLLPVRVSSAIGSRFAQKIGPLLGVHKTAKANINLAMPELDEGQVDEVLKKMWDNLGRTIFEFPYMAKITPDNVSDIVEIKGLENLDQMNKGGFFFTAHIANWELAAVTCAVKNKPLNVVYRRANNPYVDSIIRANRDHYQTEAIEKGSVGARKIIKALGRGEFVGMLVDQKQNDGIDVPFFGKRVRTAPAIANLALKYDCPICPIQVIRKDGCKFEVIIHKAIQLKKTGDREKDFLKAMKQINKIVEKWVRQHPEQWFRVHNRWPEQKKIKKSVNASGYIEKQPFLN